MNNSEKLSVYKLNLKIEKLKFILKRFDNQINVLIQDIDRKNELINKVTNSSTINKLKKEVSESKKELEKNRLKSSRLNIVIQKQEIKMKILKLDELLKDDEIALVNNMNELEGKYNIIRIDNQQKVGFISFSPNDYESEIGSVGYGIVPRFRGNNYAYKALKLLSNYLSNNGVDKISIASSIDNIPSISIMEKFKNNGIVEEQSVNEKDIKKYSYSLSKKKD